MEGKQIFSDHLLAKWLQEFKSNSTKKVYRAALRKFKKNVGIVDLDKYMKDSPDTTADIKKFLISMEDKPSKTINTYAGAVKVFFQDQGVKVSDEAWNKIRRRGFMPKRVKAQTQDKKPSKPQLKQILNYADIKLRALTLFLISSGARIGETLQLKKDDFRLEADPPRVHIRGEYTKGGVGERTAYFSYEARDAIKDWLRIKDSMGKRDGTTYKDERVFSFSDSTASLMWNRACDKANVGIKDKRTDRRIYHLHSLRKFFRTKIGLDLDVTHALMGHAEYLDDFYLRLDEAGEIAAAYLEAMPNVSIYEVEDQELKEETEALREENEKLKKRIEQLESGKAERNGDIEEIKKQVANLTKQLESLMNG
jgi:integrase